MFFIEKLVKLKTYSVKVDQTTQKPEGRHLLRFYSPFSDPLAIIPDSAVGAVSEFPLDL